MALDINSIVSVNALIIAQGALRREFGRGIFITSSNKVSASGAGRIRTFATQTEIADAYDSGDAPYQAGAAWFSQNPAPKNLMIAGFSKVQRDTVITGKRITAALADFQALDNATIEFDGNSAGNIDFSGAGSLAAVATIIQNTISATTQGATVAFDNTTGGFIITIDTSTSVVEIADSGNLTVTDNGDKSALFGLNSPANFALGSAGETITEALDDIADTDNGFYWILPDYASLTDDDLLDVAAWAETRNYQVIADVTGDAILAANENASVAAQLAALEYQRTTLVWSNTSDYKAASIAARLSSWNPSATASLPTAKFKTLPGRVPDVITTTQKRELDRKKVNHYSPFGGVSIFAEGTTLKPGSWIDVVLWVDWFVDAVRIDVFNLMQTSPTRIPQTARGEAAIQDAVERVCEQGVTNGGIASGTVSATLASVIRDKTDNPEFDGTLTNGYIVNVPAFADQPQNDRAQRRSTAVFVALKGSGAIHFAEITINFEN